MKSFQSHLNSTQSGQNLIIKKPIFRSSAIFPFLVNKKMNTNIYFLGYWLIKRNIKQITILVTIRNKYGNIFKRFKKTIDTVKSYTISLRDEIDLKYKNNFFGSIELEVFSSEDMVFPYPAFVINLDGKNSSSFVHTCGRIYNDIYDLKENNQFTVPETGFDIINNKNFLPFFSFVNGNKILKNSKIILVLINSQGKTKKIIKIFKKINSYETIFFHFLKEKEKSFFKNHKGTVKIYHNFKSFFPRFLAGNLDIKKENSSITHTYYDLSKKNDLEQYWKNPNKKDFYDSSTAVPLINKQNIFTELAIYPNFSKINFDLNLQVFNTKGKLLGEILNFFKVKKSFQKPHYINLNEVIKKNNINLEEKSNFFCRIYTTSKNKILTRLKFGLNFGSINKNEDSLTSNICFNVNVPFENFYKKKNTFRWGLLKNNYDSQIIISNLGFLKKDFKKANLIIKFWNSYDNKYIQKKIVILDRGSYFFCLNRNKKIKRFLNKKPGWMTIQSDNPFINGWYLEISKNGSIGADHLF